MIFKRDFLSMKKFKVKKLYILIVFFITATIVLSTILLRSLIQIRHLESSKEDFRSYHIMVVGKYENRLFMQQVFNGAQVYGKKFDCAVELFVPNSAAEDKSLKELFDYSSLLNVDGIIAYVDSDTELDFTPRKSDGSEIPVVTTGMYMTSIEQISYIGTSWWEVGKKIADEAAKLFTNNQKICLVANNTQNNPIYSSLMNSLQRGLKSHVPGEYNEEKEIDAKYLMDKLSDSDTPLLVICVTEAETLKTAQLIAELGLGDKTVLVGYGNSEPLMLYLNNGVIKELICVDPTNIGETAIGQLYEYRTRGHANSYVAADIKVLRGEKK